MNISLAISSSIEKPFPYLYSAIKLFILIEASVLWIRDATYVPVIDFIYCRKEIMESMFLKNSTLNLLMVSIILFSAL